MTNLSKKTWMVLAILALLVAMTPPAMAASETDNSEESSFWDDVKSAGSGLYQNVKGKAPGWWQSVKDAGSNAVDTVKEHGPEWVDAAQEKGSELIDKGKDALQDAGDKVSGFLDDQQDQFWERTEQQIYGGSGSSDSSEVGSVGTDATSGAASDTAPDTAPDTVPDVALDAVAPPSKPNLSDMPLPTAEAQNPTAGAQNPATDGQDGATSDQPAQQVTPEAAPPKEAQSVFDDPFFVAGLVGAGISAVVIFGALAFYEARKKRRKR